ncbi:hypothetical protein ACLOJK_019898 [Asimina triloba]
MVISAPSEHRNPVLHLLHETARTPTAGDRQIGRSDPIKSIGMMRGFNPHQRRQPPFITMASDFVPISSTSSSIPSARGRRASNQPEAGNHGRQQPQIDQAGHGPPTQIFLTINGSPKSSWMRVANHGRQIIKDRWPI